MRNTYDAAADAFYLRLDPREPARGEVRHMISALVAPVSGALINLDFDGEGRLIGIECLAASTVIPAAVLADAERIG
ncbi:MAG: DUF2283 domain-containing protein [Propionibacteriaceae bacterium]|nr:DUF2283 domain-containing protein [Propionibacteriaceae bacterium]